MNQSFGTDTTVLLNSDSNSQYELWLKPWCNHELFADKEKKLSSNSCQFLMFFFFILSSQCPIRTQVFKIRIQCTTSIKNDKNVLHLFLFIRHPTGSPDVVSDCIVDDIQLKRSYSQTRSSVPVTNERMNSLTE